MAKSSKDVEIDLDALDAVTNEAAKQSDPEIVVEKSTAKSEKKEVSPAEGIEELKRKLEASDRMRREAEVQRDELQRTATEARTQVQQTNVELMASAIATVKSDQNSLRNDYRTALSIGDYEKAAEINEQVAANAAKLMYLENSKVTLENAPKPEIRSITYSDPVENFARALSPRSADWIRSHPEYVTDKKLNKAMLRAHEDAVEEGIRLESPEYFSFVEQQLGVGRQDVEIDIAPTRRASPPSAPVTRSGTGDGKRPNIVTLSPEEVEAAAMSGQTPREYYLNKKAIEDRKRMMQ